MSDSSALTLESLDESTLACSTETVLWAISRVARIGLETAERTHFTLQHMQPLAKSNHSSTCSPSLLTVRDFSMSVAVREFQCGVSRKICTILTVSELW